MGWWWWGGGAPTQSREAVRAMPLTSNMFQAEMCASITSCLRLNDILAGGSMMLLFSGEGGQGRGLAGTLVPSQCMELAAGAGYSLEGVTAR